jgi:hypothetical protein
MIAKDREGNSISVLMPDTSKSVTIDGTSVHAESAVLEAGMYRFSIVSSTGDAGVNISIGTDPTAVSGEGIYMANNSTEYFYITSQQKVSVVTGKLNLTPIF